MSIHKHQKHNVLGTEQQCLANVTNMILFKVFCSMKTLRDDVRNTANDSSIFSVIQNHWLPSAAGYGVPK